MVNRPLDAVRSPGRTVATRVRRLRSWRGAIGLSGVAAGAIMITGAFLPWVTTFAGLIAIPGVRGGNGRMLAGAGAVIALAGIAHALRGGRWSRWVIGLAGFLATGFSGFLLLQLAASLRSLSSDSMVACGGPGLWVTAAGSALAFATMFLPASAQDAPADRDNSPGLRAWAADFGSTGLRRGLQITLGVLWLADGVHPSFAPTTRRHRFALFFEARGAWRRRKSRLRLACLPLDGSSTTRKSLPSSLTCATTGVRQRRRWSNDVRR